tara:strand:+ start:247 stop:501 length:255 start_codon:yes stop_codon:yes gene_type:complete
MKNVFFALAFMLIGSFAFASTGEVIKLNKNITTSIVELKTDKSSEKAEDGWACCTVSRNGGSATVCRADGNASKACRQARRFTK